MSTRDEFEEAVEQALSFNPERVRNQLDALQRQGVLHRRERMRRQTIAYIAEREAPAVVAAFEDMLRQEPKP